MQLKTIKYMQLTPYLMFNGNCEEALNFYAKALGGGIVHLSRYEGSPMESMASDKQKIMHATMIAKEITIMGADDERTGTESKGSGAVHLNINFDNPDEISSGIVLREDSAIFRKFLFFEGNAERAGAGATEAWEMAAGGRIRCFSGDQGESICAY